MQNLSYVGEGCKHNEYTKTIRTNTYLKFQMHPAVIKIDRAAIGVVTGIG